MKKSEILPRWADRYPERRELPVTDQRQRYASQCGEQARQRHGLAPPRASTSCPLHRDQPIPLTRPGRWEGAQTRRVFLTGSLPVGAFQLSGAALDLPCRLLCFVWFDSIRSSISLDPTDSKSLIEDKPRFCFDKKYFETPAGRPGSSRSDGRTDGAPISCVKPGAAGRIERGNLSTGAKGSSMIGTWPCSPSPGRPLAAFGGTQVVLSRVGRSVRASRGKQTWWLGVGGCAGLPFYKQDFPTIRP